MAPNLRLQVICWGLHPVHSFNRCLVLGCTEGNWQWLSLYHITFCLVICTISLIISYVKPCKLTVANTSLSFYLFLFGMCGLFHYLWMLNVSTATEALELTFFLIVLASQLPVLLWASYNSACYLLPKIKHLLLPLQSKLYGTH